MSDVPLRWAIGLTSGISLDSIDAVLIRSDGRAVVKCRRAITTVYDEASRARLRSVLGAKGLGSLAAPIWRCGLWMACPVRCPAPLVSIGQPVAACCTGQPECDHLVDNQRAS